MYYIQQYGAILPWGYSYPESFIFLEICLYDPFVIGVYTPLFLETTIYLYYTEYTYLFHSGGEEVRALSRSQPHLR